MKKKEHMQNRNLSLDLHHLKILFWYAPPPKKNNRKINRNNYIMAQYIQMDMLNPLVHRDAKSVTFQGQLQMHGDAKWVVIMKNIHQK